MLETYIGTKIVLAEPSKKRQHKRLILGYKVVYEDGYVSWSPKETFERAYRKMTDAERALAKIR